MTNLRLPAEIGEDFPTGIWIAERPLIARGLARLNQLQSSYKLLWESKTGDYRLSDQLVVARDTIYFVYWERGKDWEQGICALSAATGRERWRFKTSELDEGLIEGGSSLDLDVMGGMVYVTITRLIDGRKEDDSNSTLYALDEASGEVRWRVSAYAGRDWRFSAFTITDGTISYADYEDHDRTVFLDPITGQERPNSCRNSQPSSSGNGVVFSIDGFGDVIATDETTQTELWRVKAKADYMRDRFTLHDSKVVCFFTERHDLCALDAETGRELWRVNKAIELLDPDENQSGGLDEIYTWMIRDERTVYKVVSEHGVFALDASTGVERWRGLTTKWIVSMSVVGGLLYVTSDRLYALDPVTAEELWHFTTDGKWVGPVSHADGVIYFGSDAGTIYAVETPHGPNDTTRLTGR